MHCKNKKQKIKNKNFIIYCVLKIYALKKKLKNKINFMGVLNA